MRDQVCSTQTAVAPQALINIRYTQGCQTRDYANLWNLRRLDSQNHNSLLDTKLMFKTSIIASKHNCIICRWVHVGMLDASMESSATTVRLMFCALQSLIIQLLHFWVFFFKRTKPLSF